jgi:hypothetical protein
MSTLPVGSTGSPEGVSSCRDGVCVSWKKRGSRRGRRAALALLSIAIAASIVFAYLERGHFVDSWWIWRLRSADRTTRNAAAEKLAERKCLRAVPHLVKVIAEDSEEGITEVESGTMFTTDRYRIATPLILALWRMGEEALPDIERVAETMRARIPDLRNDQEIFSAELTLHILEDLQDRSMRMEAETPQDRAMWMEAKRDTIRE